MSEFKSQPIRCPFCSDDRSKSWLKTLVIYHDTGTYFCHHCRKVGLASDLSGVEITFEAKPKANLVEEWNMRYERFSTVKPISFSEGKYKFGIKSPNGEIVGVHERAQHKISRTLGKRHFGYSGSYLEFNRTYRIVEGPFDCIYPNDVCVFGTPSKEQAKELREYNLILCPDGDIWNSEESVLKWLQPFLKNKILYIERLPNDKDPDEVPEKERKRLEWPILKSWIYKKLYGKK